MIAVVQGMRFRSEAKPPYPPAQNMSGGHAAWLSAPGLIRGFLEKSF